MYIPPCMIIVLPRTVALISIYTDIYKATEGNKLTWNGDNKQQKVMGVQGYKKKKPKEARKVMY